jgi:hypothetical protein
VYVHVHVDGGPGEASAWPRLGVFPRELLQSRRPAGTPTVHVHVNVNVYVYVYVYVRSTSTPNFNFKLLRVSGVESMHHAGERNRFADVGASADPGDGSLQAEAEARVYKGAVPAQIEVPAIRRLG